MTDFDTKTPRVDAIIDQVIHRHPRDSKASLARYFEDVHQELAPLARQLEIELQQANEKIAELQKVLKEFVGSVRASDEALKNLKHPEIAYEALMEKIPLNDFMKGLK